jgi:uncharacterized protein YndB with AHSA1/START domain
MELQARSRIKIAKSPHDVFDAIVDPNHMSQYFVSAGSARMEEGKTVTWHWDDVGAEMAVDVGKIEEDRLISFSWRASGSKTDVEIALEPKGEGTLVMVREDGWNKDDKGINALAENTQGWVGFLLGLKAYLEYGINLREGSV